MPTLPSVIVTNVQDDLIAAGLGPKTWWLHVAPIVTMPDSCPLASIWIPDTDFDILSGAAGVEAFERKHTVNISWRVFSAAMADTGGTGDPATVQALETVGEQIINRVATYAAGMPGIGPEMVGTLRSRRVAPLEGSVWELLVELVAEEAA
jgi:hypothetical protein